jgi:1-phosphatidylinositol phosphodiesterase
MKQENLKQADSHQVSPQLSDTFDVESSRPKGYSHNGEAKVSYPDWLSKLDGNKRLSELSIPGTHDTMSFYGGDAVETQSMSLENQLESGVRVLDIRCRHIADVFAIHHGMVFQKVFFGDVLNIAAKFLKSYPSETIYMRVKEEYDPSNNTRTFEETFKIGYWDSYQEYFWKPQDSSNPSNPTLNETKGKIVILQNFSSSQFFGISWENFSIQDEYSMTTNWDLYSKWLKVKEHLKLANEGDLNTKYINFLTASGGSFPYFVVSGQSSPQTSAPRLLTGRTTPGWKNSWPDFPRISCFIGICSIAFEGTNNLTAERLGSGKEFANRTGILMTDFPGPDLLTRIIEMNQ